MTLNEPMKSGQNLIKHNEYQSQKLGYPDGKNENGLMRKSEFQNIGGESKNVLPVDLVKEVNEKGG